MDKIEASCGKNVDSDSTNSASHPVTVDNLKKKIERISVVTGTNCRSQHFTKVNGPGRVDIEASRNERVLRKPKNIELCEELSETPKIKSTIPMEFAEDYEIIAEIRSTNAGLSHSNRKLERLWRMDTEKNSPSEATNNEECDAVETTRSRCLQLDENKIRRNVLLSSLLKKFQEEEEKKEEEKKEARKKKQGCGGESRKKDTRTRRSNGKIVDENSMASNIIPDPIDPDLFYRKRTVTDPNIDFTVPHVGKVNIIRPRKFQIENFNDEDIAFRRNRSRRPKNTREKKNHM